MEEEEEDTERFLFLVYIMRLEYSRVLLLLVAIQRFDPQGAPTPPRPPLDIRTWGMGERRDCKERKGRRRHLNV